MDESKNQLIQSNNDVLWFNGSPLALCATSVFKKDSSEELFSLVKFLNVQPETVTAVTVDIICYGIIKNEIDRIVDYTFTDLHATRNEYFASFTEIPLPNSETMSVGVLLKSVTAGNGQIWVNDENEKFSIKLTDKSIYTFLGKQYTIFEKECKKAGISSDKLVYAPKFSDYYWQCACGSLNWPVEEKCPLCGVEKEWLKKYTDSATLQELAPPISIKSNVSSEFNNSPTGFGSSHTVNDKQRKAENERLYAKELKKKKSTKKITAFTVILVAIVALVFGVYYFILPANNYYNAKALIESGEYDKAVEAFEALGDYGDSKEQIKIARYKKAESLEASNNMEAAAAIFKDLGDYADSASKYSSIEYRIAEDYYDSGEYLKAREILLLLGDYEDAQANADRCADNIYNDAKHLYNEHKYFNSYTEYAQLGEYKDAPTKANEALKMYADTQYNSQNYVEAIKIYQQLSGYDHVDVTLSKLSNLIQILSTSLQSSESSSVWISTTETCPSCHASSLVYSFSFNGDGKFDFTLSCEQEGDSFPHKRELHGQYKIENNKIYRLNYKGSRIEWIPFITIENISSESSVSGKNTKMVITDPFSNNPNKTLTLYGNVVDEKSSTL